MTDLIDRQTTLIELNLTWLQQALRLLDRIDDRAFTASPAGFEPHRASGHLRHIIEFYGCFLDGLNTLHVDYDSRRRDKTVETSRAAARMRIHSLMDRLASDPELRRDGAIFVRAEDATAMGLNEPFLASSIGRELQSLSSHTIHHFALIAMTLRALGVCVEETFGVAPSTLRHAAQSREAALCAQ